MQGRLVEKQTRPCHNHKRRMQLIAHSSTASRAEQAREDKGGYVYVSRGWLGEGGRGRAQAPPILYFRPCTISSAHGPRPTHTGRPCLQEGTCAPEQAPSTARAPSAEVCRAIARPTGGSKHQNHVRSPLADAQRQQRVCLCPARLTVARAHDRWSTPAVDAGCDSASSRRVGARSARRGEGKGSKHLQQKPALIVIPGLQVAAWPSPMLEPCRAPCPAMRCVPRVRLRPINQSAQAARRPGQPAAPLA